MIKDFHIIIVTFNRKNFLKNCIKSIINQKNVSIYLDIIDNGSSDGTREYLSNEFKFTKKNLVINIYTLENNIDPVIAITTTISAYKGRIINFIGDDDWLCRDNILYEIKEIFKNNSYDCSSVFTLLKKINLYNHEENFIFTKTNKELMSFDKKLIKKLNFYEVIYSQVIQWRLTIISKLNKKLLKNSHKFYKNIRYHPRLHSLVKNNWNQKVYLLKKSYQDHLEI